jgi:indolepyruvate ferredoxin oxidoreductase
MIDPRFSKTSGSEAFTGNELLVKGALEAGVGLITGYPGSPVSDVFDVLHSIAPYLAERGIVAQIANNEALSTARLNGARQAGLRAMAVMKSVGLHVAADALAVGNLMETRKPAGGAVVVVGDDPWNETTQINSDSRFLSRHLNMPIVEPSTFQELKDNIAHAFDLSGASDLYVTYILTTNQADGGGNVDVKPHRDLPINKLHKTTLSSSDIVISDSVMIPPHTSWREATLEERMQRFLARAQALGLNKWIGPRHTRMAVGFVASGLAYSYLEDVLRILGLWGELPVLKLGVTYPLDQTQILDFARRVEHLVVVEEKRGFLEGQIAEILVNEHQAGHLKRPPALWGKKFPNEEPGFPSTRGLNASVVLEILGPAFLRWKEYFPQLKVEQVERELAEIQHTKTSTLAVPMRPPTFCPGCPHRDSAVASIDLKKKFLKKEEPVDVIFHGESGCHSMLQFAPFEGLMQNYSGMGLGGGTGAGMAPFVTNKQVVFLGDSTFFHSGIVAISDSIKNNQDILYIILENKTTAMTGHQPTPGNEVDVMGNYTVAQDIETVLRGIVSPNVTLVRANPADRQAYQVLLNKTVEKPGVKIIIADKECAITLHRRLNADKKRTIKEQGYLAREEKINISHEACEFCLECTRATGCPGLTVAPTAYGPKIQTDLSLCVDDAACSRTKACPSFEKVVITRSNAPRKAVAAKFDMSLIPVPALPEIKNQWTAYTAAVGGMGAGIVNAVLVRAATKQGLQVSFLDKKGLAIRNGGVYGHVIISTDGMLRSPVIPYGKADLLVGLDLLETARAVDGNANLRVAHPVRTHGVINNHRSETVLSLMGKDNLDPAVFEKLIQESLTLGGFLSADFSRLAEDHLGSKLYANVMALGAAYQKGWIPLEEKHLLAAIAESVRASDVEANHRAFRIGRYFAFFPNGEPAQEPRKVLQKTIDEKAGYLLQSSWLFGASRSRSYRNRLREIYRWMELPDDVRVTIAHTVYDLVRYGEPKLLDRYVELVWRTYKKDQKKFNYEATRAVISNLFRVMAIKDEVWVAELLTSPEKYQRDKERYKIDEANGDRLAYVHFNRPRFTFFKWNIEFDMNTRDWMLGLMKHAGFLRRVLPGWHAKEKAFRKWYMAIVEGFTFFEFSDDYNAYVEALKTPAEARGYREVRYPLMEKAAELASQHLQKIRKLSPMKEDAPVYPGRKK